MIRSIATDSTNIGAAVRALASQPLVPRQVARSFALLCGARRAIYYPGDGASVSTTGIDAAGTHVRRYTPSAFEAGPMILHEGVDGLLPIDDRDPEHWCAIRLGEYPVVGGILLTGLSSRPHGEDLMVLNAFVDLAIARIVADRDIRRARHAASTDDLTGLLRRDALAEVVSGLESYVLAVIDLNGLKRINDGQGHEAGDRYIRRAADALRMAVRPGDPIARFGGDEFVCAMGGGSSEIVERRLREACVQHGVSASIGTVLVPREAATFDEGLRVADERMYAQKNLYYASAQEGGGHSLPVGGGDTRHTLIL